MRDRSSTSFSSASSVRADECAVSRCSRCVAVELAVERQLDHAEHAAERRPDLVAHVGEEVALGDVGGVGRAPGPPQPPRRDGQDRQGRGQSRQRPLQLRGAAARPRPAAGSSAPRSGRRRSTWRGSAPSSPSSPIATISSRRRSATGAIAGRAPTPRRTLSAGRCWVRNSSVAAARARPRAGSALAWCEVTNTDGHSPLQKAGTIASTVGSRRVCAAGHIRRMSVPISAGPE